MDYYLEFYSAVHSILTDVSTGSEFSATLKSYLFDRTYGLRAGYNALRKQGYDADRCKRILKIPLSMSNYPPCNHPPISHFTFVSQSGCLPHESILMYVRTQRQLAYIYPFISTSHLPLLLLCHENLCIPPELLSNNFIYTIRLQTHNAQHISLQGVTESFTNLLSRLAPRSVITVEGCHYEQMALAETAEKLSIPSILIQNCWPSFFHTLFRDMPFTHHLTWGEGFSRLFNKYSSRPIYHPVGYLGNFASETNMRKSIAFFLQAPVLLNDEDYQIRLFNLIQSTATRYPELDIIVKEHPDFIHRRNLSHLSKYDNIKIVGNDSAETIFAKSIVVVSHFSTSIMECLLHGCIPLVFDPTTHSNYTPDIKTLGLGETSKSEVEFESALQHILHAPYTYLTQIENCKGYWFAAQGNSAVNNAHNILLNCIVP